MKRKRPPKTEDPTIWVAVCRICGDLVFDPSLEQQDRCWVCRPKTSHSTPPQAQDDPDAFGRKELE